MLRKAAAAIAILLVAGIAYLTLAPVPVEPVAWQAPPAPGYAGPHARNTRLANLQHLAIGNEEGLRAWRPALMANSTRRSPPVRSCA